MKKFIAIISLLLISFIPLLAQKNKDILYLKDGGRIFGDLREISDNQYKIWVNDSTLLTFPTSEVEKYTKEKYIARGRKGSGIGYSLEGGILLGSQSTPYDTPFSFNILFHYSVNTSNIFGFGTGVEFLGKSFTPLFLEYRKLFHEKGTTPFLFARAGEMAYFGSNDNTTYSYNPQYYLRKDYFGGTSFTIGTGISWVSAGIETNLSFAYRYCRTGYKQTEYLQSDVTYVTNYNRLEVKLGFRF